MHRSPSRERASAQHRNAAIDLSGVIPDIAPPVAVSEALSHPEQGGEDLREVLLRHRLAADYRLSERNLVLVKDIDAALDGLAERSPGPLVVFPPSGAQRTASQLREDRQVIEMARGIGRDGTISLDSASDLPHDGLAIVSSPGDPLGNVLAANDAVRLARSCKWLVIDERYAEYAGQSLLNVASEFANVVIVRSFQARLGATETNAGWIGGSVRARELLSAVATPVPAGIVQGVLAAHAAKNSGRILLSLVRDERSRLYRALRKLSYLQPLPSWGPFVAARVEVGERATLLALLEARGILVHAPQDPGLERYVRIGIGTRSSMERLRRVLLDIAPDMLGAGLAGSSCDPYRLTLRGEELSQSEFREVEERGKRSA